MIRIHVILKVRMNVKKKVKIQASKYHSGQVKFENW